jgi:hypothetical protein
MRLGFMTRLRNGYGNIYTPHAGSMIIQVQRETGLANRTIVISERQVALVRLVGSRIGLAVAVVFAATWLLFAIQSIRVPVLSVRIAELERDSRRLDSLQVALSRMHGRYEQVRQMLAAGGTAVAHADSGAVARSTPRVETAPTLPNAKPRTAITPPAEPPKADTGAAPAR